MVERGDEKSHRTKEPNQKRSRRNLNPLIPSHILDQASQRLFIVSFFILIQSWKLYDVLILKSDLKDSTSLSNFSFVLKYAVIDGLFIWLLPVLNIQYLRFSPLKALVITLILNSITFFLMSSKTVPFIMSFLLPLWKAISSSRELTIVGDSINTNKVIDMESHFKGRLTIHYLPDSSAKFNPFHFDKVCLDKSSNQLLDMPIEFNTTTDLGFLQLQHITPDNKIHHLNFTGNALKKLIRKDYTHLSKYPEFNSEDNRIFYLEVPLKESGLYRISKVTDVKDVNIRTYKSEFLISYCPRVKFSYPPSYDESKNYKCLNNKDNEALHFPLMNIFGVTPATLKLNVNLNGKRYKTINSTIGEINSIPNIAPQSKSKAKDVSWLEAHELTRNSIEQEILRNPQILSEAREGILEFQLVEVIDYLGNAQRYNPASKDKDIWFEYELKKAPILGLEDPNENIELLINGTKTIKITSKNQIKATDYPFTADISYTNPEDALLSYNISRTFKNSEELESGIVIDKPGIYQLESATNRYCSCDVSSKNRIVVNQAQPPQIEISAEPIVDKCLGTTGYLFDLNLIGKPPFQVKYQVYQKQKNNNLRPVHSEKGTIARLLKTYDNHYSFKFSPPAEGNYVIVFSELQDVNYHSRPVLLDETRFTYSTYFNQVSKVSFFEKEGRRKVTKNLCAGKSTSIPLFFTGNGPYSFDIDFLDTESGNKLINTVKIKEVSGYEIDTPSSLGGRKYRVKVSNIKDKFSCGAIINDEEEVIINSRDEVPEVQIGGRSLDFKVVEGDYVQIPLDISSSLGKTNSDRIEFKVTNLFNSSDVSHKVLRGGSNHLKVKEEGVYSLVSFENGECPGKVVNPEKSVKLSYYSKPNITVYSGSVMKQHKDDSSIHLNPLCQNRANPLKLSLEGSGPFLIDYEIKFPNGKVESKSMSIENSETTINLPTSESGRFEYILKGVYDRLYTKQKSKRLRRKVFLPRVLYDIHPLPNAQFEVNEQFSQICESMISSRGPVVTIPISLTGSYPFKINASLTHESTGKVESIIFDNLQEPKLELYSKNPMGLGEHVLSINEVSDANGCGRDIFSSLNNYVVVITEVPNVSRRSERKHFCVGDHIAYNISGIPPFAVFYEFNGNSRKAESTYNFRRLASKPGTLRITGLQDSSASRCLVNFTEPARLEDLSLYIHDLPSVEVNKGDYIVEDIHEGDQTDIVFSFVGTPPFTLTYTRTVEVASTNRKGRYQKVVEKHVVEDIQDYEYSVLASLEGTYEAIEVSDAFCKATRKQGI